VFLSGEIDLYAGDIDAFLGKKDADPAGTWGKGGVKKLHRRWLQLGFEPIAGVVARKSYKLIP
jgi:hypothetical protein